MNFGSGRKNEYVGINSNTNFSYDKNEVDVFGLSAERGARSQNNKNYFHSLPMNWYHEHAPYNYNDWKDSLYKDLLQAYLKEWSFQDVQNFLSDENEKWKKKEVDDLNEQVKAIFSKKI